MNTTSEGILCPDSSESNSTPHILTADEFEALMNYVDPEPIKTALMDLKGTLNRNRLSMHYDYGHDSVCEMREVLSAHLAPASHP